MPIWALFAVPFALGNFGTTMRLGRSHVRIAVAIGCTTMFLFLADMYYHYGHRLSSARGLTRWWATYYFSDPPPSWLLPVGEQATSQPLRIRMAVISRPEEFEKRMALRLSVVREVPHVDVNLTYVFVIDIPDDPGDFPEALPLAHEAELMIRHEAKEWNDMLILNLGEGPRYMGEKRWMMLQWAASVDSSQFDLYLSSDTDSFVRLAALARRLHHLRPGVDLTQHSLFWGHMLDYHVHWTHQPGPADRSIDDPSWDGSDYRYPAGMAFLLSSALVRTLTSPGIELPRHISYNRDDVMHGMWVADYAPETDILDDPAGFHDPRPLSGWRPARPIDYNAICVHHISPAQMKELRQRPEYKITHEWRP